MNKLWDLIKDVIVFLSKIIWSQKKYNDVDIWLFIWFSMQPLSNLFLIQLYFYKFFKFNSSCQYYISTILGHWSESSILSVIL